MLALKITDTRSFKTKLLAQDTFDTFLFSEGSVTTFTTFAIDGTWHPDYFGENEQPEPDSGMNGAFRAKQPLTWRMVRPVIYDIIKGRHTPINMRIILKLADYNVEHLLANAGLSLSKEQVDGLFLNLNYGKETVTATTGTSMKVFTLDRSLDRVWDDMVRRFLETRGILFDEE